MWRYIWTPRVVSEWGHTHTRYEFNHLFSFAQPAVLTRAWKYPHPFPIRYWHCRESTTLACSSFSLTNLRFRRYTRWVTRFVAVATIGAIWILAAFVSFVPISLGLHRPNEPLIIEIRDGKEYPTCALDLTPTYAMVSSCISFYVPCIVLVGIYCR